MKPATITKVDVYTRHFADCPKAADRTVPFHMPGATPYCGDRVKRLEKHLSGTRINSGPKTPAQPVSDCVRTYGLMHKLILKGREPTSC